MVNETRAPTKEEIKRKVLADYEKGIKQTALSKKYDTSINTVKSWIRRHKQEQAKDAPKEEKGAPPKKKRGAPQGNKNAVGAGAPEGNQNAVKHGAYSSVYWDVLTAEERGMIEGTPTDEEALLIEQIQLFAVRERRIMQAINKYMGAKGGQYISGVSSSEDKRKFETKEDKQLYNDAIEKKVRNNERLPGQRHTIQTNTGATIDLISRLERELTSVQSKKTKVIDSLFKLRLENRKLDGAGKGNEMVDDWIAAVMDEIPEEGDSP